MRIFDWFDWNWTPFNHTPDAVIVLLLFGLSLMLSQFLLPFLDKWLREEKTAVTKPKKMFTIVYIIVKLSILTFGFITIAFSWFGAADFTIKLFTVIQALLIGFLLSLVNMNITKRELFICGLLFWVLGNVFNVHDVSVACNDFTCDGISGFSFAGFELNFLNKPLMFLESSSFYYILSDFILFALRRGGLMLATTTIALKLWDCFCKRIKNKKDLCIFEREQ